MKRVIVFLLIVCLITVLSLKESSAETYAYLIGTDGSVLKINTDTDSVVSNLILEKSSYVQSGEKSVVTDKINNHLLVIAGRLTPSIYVYDLKKLTFIKDLGIVSGNPDVDILVSPNGKQLFIRWFDYKERGWFFDLYDAKNLSEIRNLGEFVWGPNTTFSPDGNKIYVYNGETDKIIIYETTSFNSLDTIDLNTIWRKDVFAQGVEDIKNGKVLISETDKSKLTDPSKDTLFVNSLETKTSSPRISTGMSGDEKLSLDGTKIFLNEEQVIRSPEGSYLYAKSLGRFHIYDVMTGKSLGFVQFTVDSGSGILGIHPNGNKVYMLGDIAGVRSLIVMDVVNFKVLKTLKVSENILFIIFYEE